jgi:hypothetical protein
VSRPVECLTARDRSRVLLRLNFLDRCEGFVALRRAHSCAPRRHSYRRMAASHTGGGMPLCGAANSGSEPAFQGAHPGGAQRPGSPVWISPRLSTPRGISRWLRRCCSVGRTPSSARDPLVAFLSSASTLERNSTLLPRTRSRLRGEAIAQPASCRRVGRF